MSDLSRQHFSTLLNNVKNEILEVCKKTDIDILDKLSQLDTDTAIVLVRLKIKPRVNQLDELEHDGCLLLDSVYPGLSKKITVEERTRFKRYVKAFCELV